MSLKRHASRALRMNTSTNDTNQSCDHFSYDFGAGFDTFTSIWCCLQGTILILVQFDPVLGVEIQHVWSKKN